MQSDTTLVAKADLAIAAGDLPRAVELLSQATADGEGDPAILLKLAGIQRAAGRTKDALTTVNRALSISPRDFMALLMRASLMDRLDPAAAAEAWSHALAQQPAGELPPQVAGAIARGKASVEAWRDARYSKMKAAMAEAESTAGPELQQRFERFRTNALNITRTYHSEPTRFHYPGLVEREFYPATFFPWLESLEAATDDIAAELDAVMAAERRELVPYIQYDEHVPLDQWKPLNHSLDWAAIHLLQNGKVVEANARHCPRTMEILQGCDQPRVAGASPNAMFSMLAPQTGIPPHVGVNNARLVCHLPLVVPEGCWFRVGAETRYWKRGEALVFDDTIEHEAFNPSDQLRVVLIFDVWHPELTPVERDAVAALIEAELPSGKLGL